MKTLCDKITKKKSRRSLLFLKSHFRICAISIVHTKTIRKIFTFCHRVKRYSRHHCTALLAAAAFTPKYHFLHVMFPKWEISTGRKWRKVQQDIQNLMMVLLVWKVITFCIAAKGFLFSHSFILYIYCLGWIFIKFEKVLKLIWCAKFFGMHYGTHL